MQKHVGFCFGVLIGCTTCIPVIFGAMGYVEGEIRSVFAYSSAALIAISIFFTVALLFRDRILRLITGRAEANIQNAVNHALKACTATMVGKDRVAAREASSAISVYLNWYVWTGFYRWVFATLIALLLVITGSVGTLLLFEQNKKLSQQNEQISLQNELSAQDIVDKIRKRLSVVVEKNNLFSEVLEGYGTYSLCGVNETGKLRNGLPNGSEIESIAALGRNALIKDRIETALGYLLNDDNSTVALGAAQTLDAMGFDFGESRINVRGIKASELQINSSADVWILESEIDRLICPNCTLHINRSIVGLQNARAIASAEDSLIVSKAWEQEGQIAHANPEMLGTEASSGAIWTVSYTNNPNMFPFLRPIFYEFENNNSDIFINDEEKSLELLIEKYNGVADKRQAISTRDYCLGLLNLSTRNPLLSFRKGSP